MAMPERLLRALERPGYEVLVARPSMREAVETLRSDARDLVEALGDMFTAQPGRGRITLANGSRIVYVGGTVQRLAQSVRGMQVDQIDGEQYLGDLVDFLTIHKKDHS